MGAWYAKRLSQSSLAIWDQYYYLKFINEEIEEQRD